MRQVPAKQNYLLIGSGRLAYHLAYYLRHLKCSLECWNRKEQSLTELSKKIDQADIILLCISDDQIADFFKAHNRDNKIFVHFSGSRNFEGVLGFHPLMTFGKELYDINSYSSIHWIGSHAETLFHSVFPKFSNSYSMISADKKSLYHSLCVLSGNGTTLLWDLILQEFSKLGLPQQAIQPYLDQVTKNIISDEQGRWSGPWYRQDKETIELNKQALHNSQLEGLYEEMQKLSQSSGHCNEKHH